MQAKTLIEKDTESRLCVGGMDGFLVLFDTTVMKAEAAVAAEGSHAMTESQSASAICSS